MALYRYSVTYRKPDGTLAKIGGLNQPGIRADDATHAMLVVNRNMPPQVRAGVVAVRVIRERRRFWLFGPKIHDDEMYLNRRSA